MIIFDLDGTLADRTHRLHLLKPENYPKLCEYSNYHLDRKTDIITQFDKPEWRYKDTGEAFEKGFDSFESACDKDALVIPVAQALWNCWAYCDYTQIEIWSGRSESVREKTEAWLLKYALAKCRLRMRPIGDNTPDDKLKEKWLDQTIADGNSIEHVYDDRPKVIAMWRRRGIFVFDCNQTGDDF